MLPAVLLGVDGSNNNGVPELGAAKLAGYRFLWWKVTEGQAFVDLTWPRVKERAAAVHLPHGGYHYGIAKAGGPVRQADHFVDQLDAQPWQLLPFLDLEEEGSEGVGGRELEAFAWDFGRRVCKRLGIGRMILYANGDMLRNRGLDSGRLRDLYLLDYAYPSSHQPALPERWVTVLWQFDWSGQVPGFRGPVDRDYLLPPHRLDQLTISAQTPPRPAPKPPRSHRLPDPPHGA